MMVDDNTGAVVHRSVCVVCVWCVCVCLCACACACACVF